MLVLDNGDRIDPDARTVTTADGERPMTAAEVYLFVTEPAQARAESDLIVARATATQDTFDLLYAATTAIREWCMDTQAWLYTGGAFGAFDEAGFLALVQQAESAGLAYNALPADDLTPALIQEQAGMALRGQQAQILYGMAKGAA